MRSGTYTYAPGSNRLTARHGKAVTTDAAGNITADGQGHTYVYNQRGYLSEARLNGVLLASYTYDYRGLRTRKVTTAAAPQGAQVVRYTYDEAHHLIAETSGTGAAIRTYVWRDDTPLAQIDHVPSRRIIYLETDHLNTPRVARDQARNVVWAWDSDAFGATPPNPNPSGAGVVTINLRFPGQYYDQETGLHYNGFRYYHPGMGQYIQPDPIGLRGGSFSTYAYVGGNPLRYVDPLGLEPLSSIVKLGVKGEMKIKKMVCKEAAVEARRKGQNVLAPTRQQAKEIEKAANGGKPVLKHDGHDLADGSTGKPHFQTDGVDGHTFYGAGVAGGVGVIGQSGGDQGGITWVDIVEPIVDFIVSPSEAY